MSQAGQNSSPSNFTSLTRVNTNGEMEESCLELIKDHKENIHVVMLASVLDYIPQHKSDGKIRSGSATMKVELIPTDKIISKLNPSESFKKIGFKLEPSIDEQTARDIANNYCNKYQLSQMVLNSFKDVSRTNHKAYLFTRDDISQK